MFYAKKIKYSDTYAWQDPVSFEADLLRSVQIATFTSRAELKGMTPNIVDVYANPMLFRECILRLASFFKAHNVTKIMGVAARGLPLAVEVANYLHVPYVILGKSGKMPGVKMVSPAFEDNYYQEQTALEIKFEHISTDDRIGIIDDKIYSGAQLKAAMDILDSRKVTVAGIGTLVSFPDKLETSYYAGELKKYPIYSLVQVSADQTKSIDDKYGALTEINNYKIKKFNNDELKKMILLYPNFPKEGVIWTDFSGVQINPEAYKYAIKRMAEAFSGYDTVVSVAVRGLDFGASLANYKCVKHIMAVKPRMSDYEVLLTKSYSMEYNDAVLGIPKRLIKPSDKVLLVDDITATGGTLQTAYKLVEAAGAEIIGAVTLIGLTDLMNHSSAFQHTFAGKKKHFSLINFSNKELQQSVVKHSVNS